ncbi:serine/threonine dehydratase [Sabulicella glaciei]|uniref:Serine/threonine dehydratase n=1 Tax=Sabulicella glaciei TaxID=2984948 RepID=A0ABT3NX86_9PROT|nr:serine/threonine dehydratase [Roseococcus sp. MDT2-1-1]MCW8086774.1 serine/threonine dehydratase [Roseococcus sp. MDT2-1-1]
MTLPNRDSVSAAHRLIEGDIRRTPVMSLPGLGVLKLEHTQLSGSFKARGAFHCLRAAGAGAAGVIAASGGNHGAAVAAAAQSLGVTAEIFVPAISAQAKQALIRSFGARLVVGGAAYDEAREAAERRAAETGALTIHAYDQPEVIAGQGTAAREWEEQSPGLSHLLIAVGGGGLIGGFAAWHAESGPTLIAVEPEGCPTLAEALQAGRPVPAPVGGVAADSLGARQVGALMFPLVARLHAAGRLQSILVPDAAIREAQRRLWAEARLLVEPGGASALAALLSGRWMPPEDARPGILLCGGNTDPASLAA